MPEMPIRRFLKSSTVWIGVRNHPDPSAVVAPAEQGVDAVAGENRLHQFFAAAEIDPGQKFLGVGSEREPGEERHGGFPVLPA